MKIETEDYAWECGDGCCISYGTILYIDDKQVEDREFSSCGDAYKYVLEEILGHTTDYIYEEDEE